MAFLNYINCNNNSVFECLRTILHEGTIEKRSQFIIEGLFAIRKAGFETAGFKSVTDELDLVEEEDQITHEIGLDEDLNPEMHLDVFKKEDDFEKNEQEYNKIKVDILGNILIIQNTKITLQCDFKR